jgi:hypothetical protein
MFSPCSASTIVDEGATDAVSDSVVDFFTVPLPIPRFLSFPIKLTPGVLGDCSPSDVCDFEPGPDQPEKSSGVS